MDIVSPMSNRPQRAWSTRTFPVHGYDLVAYFTDGKPVIGDAKNTAVYNGAAYYFASADHKKTFEANPVK
jgi:YHS domain-containing protein